MPHRTLMADLRNICTVLNNTTGRKFYIESAYGQPRLYEEIGEHGASREVSPRLPKGALYDWIEAYLDGFSLAYRKKPDLIYQGDRRFYEHAIDWIEDRLMRSTPDEVLAMAQKMARSMDSDQIQGLFEDLMDEDEYFKPTEVEHGI